MWHITVQTWKHCFLTNGPSPVPFTFIRTHNLQFASPIPLPQGQGSRPTLKHCLSLTLFGRLEWGHFRVRGRSCNDFLRLKWNGLMKGRNNYNNNNNNKVDKENRIHCDPCYKAIIRLVFTLNVPCISTTFVPITGQTVWPDKNRQMSIKVAKN